MSSTMGYCPTMVQESYVYSNWSPALMQTIHEEHTPNVRVRNDQFFVRSVADLHTAPSLENAMAHQRYLEMLSFEAHSRMISEQITAEREQTHNQLAAILDGYAATQKVNVWTRAPAAQSMAPRPMASPPPRPQMGSMQLQTQPHSQTLQVKPAPSRSPAQQLSSSSSTLPSNQPFPPQQGADPWYPGWREMRKSMTQ